jgi:hypothetical protein
VDQCAEELGGHVTPSATSAGHNRRLAATQTRDGREQLATGKNHSVFNRAWVKEPPNVPGK